MMDRHSDPFHLGDDPPPSADPILPTCGRCESNAINQPLNKRGDCLFFTGLATTFLKQFATGIELTFPLWLFLAAVIALIGQMVGRKEGWSRLDSLYWSFITATTVGYGDFRPVQRGSRLLAVLIAFLGLILSGIIISVAVEATTKALETVRH